MSGYAQELPADEWQTDELSADDRVMMGRDEMDGDGVSLGWTTNGIEGQVRCQENAVLYLAVPWEDGWQLYVDGERTEGFAVYYGYTGVALEAGEHEIEMRYQPPGLKGGVLVSFLGLSACAAVSVLQNRRKMKGDSIKDRKSCSAVG